MTTIFRLYVHHGLIINLVVLGGMLLLSIAMHLAPRFKPSTANAVQTLWIIGSLTFILVMTMSPSRQGVIVGFQLFPVVSWISQFFNSQATAFHWPEWHDTVGNVMLMVPLATALALTWSKRRTILGICGLSVSIEITQHFYGHGRTAQVSDIILNTTGGVLGVGLAALGATIANRISSKAWHLIKTASK
jgi:glycopeptide antibiotics resistance protein